MAQNSVASMAFESRSRNNVRIKPPRKTTSMIFKATEPTSWRSRLVMAS